MAEFTTAQKSLIASVSLGSGSSSASVVDDSIDDACSICLEHFTLDDPSTMTTCKHEYHLHCILEWSQRSNECPICLQSLSLKEPTSQELLDVIDRERNARRRNILNSGSAYPHHNEESDSECRDDDPDFNRRIMRQLATMMSRARQAHRNVGQRTMHPNTHEEWSFTNDSFEGSSPTSNRSSIDIRRALLHWPSFVESSSGSASVRDTQNHFRPRQSQSSDDTEKLRSSEMFSFSESIKSRLSSASTRYKDSISKGTHGFREKFLAHNNSVKELSKGVQREMNSSIASVARMIERLDLKSKRNSRSGEGFSRAGETPNSFRKGKGVLDNIIANSHENRVATDLGITCDQQSLANCSMPSHVDIHHAERGN